MCLNTEYVWSDKFYEDEAERIEVAYYSLLKNRVPDIPPPRRMEKTEHRIEALVRRISRNVGKGNIHVGLTSSDLEDNIRHMRLFKCNENLEYRLAFLGRIFSVEMPDKKMEAYTHLLPAGETTLLRRLSVGWSAIATKPPPPVFRGIKGALGDRRIQHRLGIADQDLDNIFPGSVEVSSSQASNKEYDYDVACWLAKITAGLVKTANDIRMMVALGQATIKNNDIGSTALPHKRPNPWRFERIAGMGEVIFDLPGRVARTIANCLLERTLTDQSLLNHTFKEAYTVLSNIIIDLEHGIKKVEFNSSSSPFDSEVMMLNFIKEGIPREEAHKEVKKYADKRSISNT